MSDRWPTKPRAGTRCEASAGVNYHRGQPTVMMCGQPATESVKSRLLPFDVPLCAACAEAMEAAGKIQRNPKRHPHGDTR